MREEAPAETDVQQDDFLRIKRRRATRYRRRRIRLTVGFGVFCLVVAGILIAIFASGNTEQVSAQRLAVADGKSNASVVSSASETEPAFARTGDRNLLLPIAAGDATIIAYQPVDDQRAVTLSPIGERVNSNAVGRFFRNLFSGSPSIRYYMIDGKGGTATSSVLVGAAAGSPVTSPVSGVVTAVKQYKLQGKYDDIQIDIQPEEMSGTTLSIMFVSDVAVSIGDAVSAGKTQLGKVRACPKGLGLALTPYTHDSGSHVHMIVTQGPIS
jgi:hypothetical protein